MIYGYDVRTVNEYGLKQMDAISIHAHSNRLRSLGEFLLEVAAELESKSTSANWHRHLPKELCEALGCDVIVNGGPGSEPEPSQGVRPVSGGLRGQG
jgi:hypothetical protein